MLVSVPMNEQGTGRIMSGELTEIFLDVRQSLLWNVVRIVRDFQVAEDLTQETYIRATKAVDSGPVDNVEAFLHRTARNLALDHLRRRGTRARVEAEGLDTDHVQQIGQDIPSIEDVIIERQRLGHIAKALSGLPKRAQAVILLSRLENWSNRRIAEYLGVSERTVFNDLKMAMGHCRDALLKYDRSRSPSA